MKQLSLYLFIIAGMAVMIASCGKEPFDNPNSGGGGTPGTLPKEPTTLTLRPDTTVMRGDTAVNGLIRIIVTTDGQTVKAGSLTVTGGSITLKIKNDTTVNFSATNTNANGTSTAKTASIQLYAYTQKTKMLNNQGMLHVTENKYCVAGTENSPTVIWLPGAEDCHFYHFNADGTTNGFIGPCGTNPAPGTPTSGVWAWNDRDQTSTKYSGYDVWNTTILSDGVDRYRYMNGFYQIQKFRQ